MVGFIYPHYSTFPTELHLAEVEPAVEASASIPEATESKEVEKGPVDTAVEWCFYMRI